MRRAAAMVALAFSVPGIAAAQTAPPTTGNLLPVPASVTFRAGRLALDSTFTVGIAGHDDGRLRRGVDRALVRLEGRIGIRFQRTPVTSPDSATLVINADGPGMAVQGVEENESYTLDVSDDRAVMHAPTDVGILRGLETLLQLVASDSAGYYVPGVAIRDRPRFPWRGLLLDVCRHFEPVPVIERTLDAMAAVKLNVLHWHLSEDQGFRVESKKYPKLQERGSDGLYYTQEQIRNIVAYARDRGIRVVPEFDMPAHSTSWFVGYPQYASAPGPYTIEREFGVHDAAFDPTRDDVYDFISGFIGEMAGLFPDAYFHIGGDETNGKQWDANPRIQAFMRAHKLTDNAALQAYFNRHLERILRHYGKHMIGWDEILHPDLPHTVVIQSWRGPESLVQAAQQGFGAILSSGWYLDAMASAGSYYAVDPLSADSTLTDQQRARILGGEAAMWGELIDPETIDSRIWPRTAAIAERLWSPRTVTDVNDMYRRLAVVSARLEELGLGHETHVRRLVRRIVPSGDGAPLVAFLNLVEPVNLGGRMSFDHPNQLSPLTTLSDAARPDPPSRRTYTAMVTALLADAPAYGAYRDTLTDAFNRWQAIAPALSGLAAETPRVDAALPLAQDLAALGKTGLEALSFLGTGVAAPADWIARSDTLLHQAARPRAALRLTIVQAIGKLVAAAGAQR